MHKAQGTQLVDLPLFDRWLKAEVELLECFLEGQVRQLQPGLQVTLAPRIGFRTHDSARKSA
jgi:hypothetical protein